MAGQSHIYAGVAGYVGRPEEKGKVGVFRRAAAGGEWQHVLTDAGDPRAPRASDRRERGACRHSGWRVAQHRSGRHVPARELPRQGQADLVVPGRFKGCQAHLCGRVAGRCLSQRRSRRELAPAAQSGHQGPRHRPLRRARHAHGAAPQATRRDLRRAGGEWGDPHHRRRRDVGGLQRRLDPPVGTAAPQEQDRQRHLRRGHAGRARHRHQPRRSRTLWSLPAAWACSAPPTKAAAGRTWR